MECNNIGQINVPQNVFFVSSIFLVVSTAFCVLSVALLNYYFYYMGDDFMAFREQCSAVILQPK